MRRSRILAAVVVATLVAAAGVAAAVIDPSRDPQQAGLLLPDLDVAAPSGLVVEDAGPDSSSDGTRDDDRGADPPPW